MLWLYYILTRWLCLHKQLLALAAQHQNRQVLAWTPRVKIGRQRDVERATRGISENNTLISRHTKIFFSCYSSSPSLYISLSLSFAFHLT
jgi:hypothetical protein